MIPTLILLVLTATPTAMPDPEVVWLAERNCRETHNGVMCDPPLDIQQARPAPTQKPVKSHMECRVVLADGWRNATWVFVESWKVVCDSETK